MSSRPNIIVIKTDQQRYDTLGYMGHPVVQTPNIDRLAEDGVAFDKAFCPCPLCVPSRTSFFTGQYIHRTGATGNGMPCHISAEQGCLLDVLHAAGYALGLAGKNHAFQEDYFEKYFTFREEYGHWGKDYGTDVGAYPEVRAFRKTETRFPGINCNLGLMEGLIEGPEPFPQEHCTTYRIAQDAIRFVEENQTTPFFLHFSFPDPHWPNIVCEPYHSMYAPSTFPALQGVDIDWDSHPFAHFVQSRAYGFDTYTEEDTQKILAAYYGQITFIDTAIGLFLDHLNALGLYDESIIVFASDHGDFAGNYNLVAKTKAFYDSLIRIPLVMKLPGTKSGQHMGAQVSNIDVMPTILDYLGLDLPAGVQGSSFLPVLNGEADSHRSEIFAELGEPKAPPPIMTQEEYLPYQEKRLKEDGIFWFIDYTVNGRAAMVRKDGWKYCYYTADREELYHVDKDPVELSNLAQLPEYADQKEALKNRLMEWLLTEPVSNLR